MHTALYRAVGLDWDYEAKDCATEHEAQRFLEARDFLSLNITTPYKPLAYTVADVRASTAKLARGANVLIKRTDKLIAYNVDGEGCVDYLERAGFSCAGKEVVVCGTGPTSLSILHACALGGAKRVVLVGRNKDRTRKILERYVAEYGVLAFATI